MWGAPTLVLKGRLRDYVDLYASTPNHFVPFGATGRRVLLRTAISILTARPDASVSIDVSVENVSNEPTPSGKNVFGLSYHLLSDSGAVLKHDNERVWIKKSIAPGECRSCVLNVETPAASVSYDVEVDLVWEGVMWFKDAGNPTARVRLVVA